MPRQANGVYQAPANTAAVSGQSISSTEFNTLETDIGTEITNSLDRGGRSAMTAALPMGGQKIIGVADPTLVQDAATKNYVDTTTASFFSTGDVKFTLKPQADVGWVLFDDGTIGSGSSGSSNRSNADTQPLFNLLFQYASDTNCPLLTSGGAATTRAAQTNAATAWAANCRMMLPKTLGRSLAVAGSGSGLTPRAYAQFLGEEAHTLTVNEITKHTHAVAGNTGTESVTHTHSVGFSYTRNGAAGTDFPAIVNGTPSNTGGESTPHTHPINITSDDGSSSGVGSQAHNNMQPTIYLNCMVKL